MFLEDSFHYSVFSSLFFVSFIPFSKSFYWFLSVSASNTVPSYDFKIVSSNKDPGRTFSSRKEDCNITRWQLFDSMFKENFFWKRFFVSECFVIIKCSGDQNKWKSVGNKSDEYLGCERTCHPNDLVFFLLVFVLQCLPWHSHAEEYYFFYLENLNTFDVMLGLPDQVAGNRRLQWRSFHVPIARHKRYLSYHTRHKAMALVVRDTCFFCILW